LIFSNPPFSKVNSGRLSRYPEVRLSKTETRLTLKNLLEKSFEILGEKASVFLIFPYVRLAELVEIAERIGYFVAKIREVFSFKDRNPDRFLIQLTNFKVSFQNMKPLIIFNDKGNYTEEMNEIVSG
jgi:tRNA1(Val) A37 N6-methylase TrmN6